MKLPDEISIVWHIDDVLEICPKLSKKRARELLDYLKHNHDANEGINWQVIETTAQTLFNYK